MGKTHLAEAALRGAPVLRGAAQPPGAAAYGPIVAALRWRLRGEPAALDGCGPLREHLAMLLPELGPPAAASDRATMFEAIRGALSTLAPALVLLDDLQWSDGATLELLAALAAPLRELPILVVAAYRSDEVGRGHPLRRLRADLRRGRMLRELIVAPLDAAASRSWPRPCSARRVSPGLADARVRPDAGRAVLRPGARRRAAGRRPRALGPRTGSSSPTTATCPCPRRSATPCCCAPPASHRRAARPPRPRRWPAPSSRSTSSPASTSCWRPA